MFFLPTLRCAPELLSRDLAGKTYLITGGNGGVGLTAAQQLVKQGAHVVLACRRPEAGVEAQKTMEGSKGTTEVLKMDLADFKSVRDAAKEFLDKHDRLDALVNNAGIMAPPYSETVDGFESQFGTNHLGHFLLTELLMDVLKKSAPSRIVNLSSCVHAGSAKERPTVDLDDLKWEKRGYNNQKAYSQSKLANLLHAKELAKRLEGTGVTAVSAHPGWVRTNLIKFMAPLWVQNIIMRPFMPLLSIISPEEGAQATLHCLLDDKVVDQAGEFFSQNAIIYENNELRKGGFPMKSPNPNAHDDELAKRLYDTSMKLVGLE